MSFVRRLLGIRGGTAGAPRSESRVDDDEGGVAVAPRRGRDCEMCGSSLAGGASYLPYEDGSNPDAYIVCPSCRHENVRYGLGGDD